MEVRKRVRPPDKWSAEVLTMLGEADKSIYPSRWHGWPNGSAVYSKDHGYLGRIIMQDSTKYHVLRFKTATTTHTYYKVFPNFISAMSSLCSLPILR